MVTLIAPRKTGITTTSSATLARGTHTPVDASSGALTMTLPTNAPVGVEISVEKVDASTNTVTISGTFRGATSSITLTSQYEVRTFLSEGGGSWRPTSDHRTATSLDTRYAPQGSDAGGIYYAKIASGATIADKVQTAITACVAGGGGTVVIPSGTHSWTVVPKVPRNLSVSVRIRGAQVGVTKVTFTSTAPRFLDFGFRSGDGEFLQNLTVEDIEFDASGLAPNTYNSHGIIGTLRSGVGGPDSTQVNITNVTVRRCKGSGAPINTDGTHVFDWVGLRSSVGTTDPERTITNILIEDCTFTGGDSGVVVAGDRQAGAATDFAKVYLDNITIRRVSHDLGVLPTAFVVCSNFIVGARGYGRRVRVIDCYGKNSGDVGVEIDAMSDALVENTVIEDAYSAAFFHANYATSSDTKIQTITFKGCTAKRTGLSMAGVTGFGYGFQVFSNGTFGSASTVRLIDSKWYRTTPEFLLDAEAVNFLGSGRFVIENFKIALDGLSTNDATNRNPSGITIGVPASGTAALVAKNISATINGVRGGAGSVTYTLLRTNAASADLDLNVDDLSLDFQFNVAGQATNGSQIMNPASGFQSGLVQRMRYLSTPLDTNSRGVNFGASTSLVLRRLRFDDCDFRLIPSFGQEFWFTNNTPTTVAHPNFIATNTRWRVWPKVPLAITPTASPYAYQNLDGWPQRVVVSGGTVSDISISQDGTTYFATGQTAGVFPLEPGDFLKVTYSVAPTMTRVPSTR